MDPASLAFKVIGRIVALAEEAQSNQEDCEHLAKLAKQTETILRQIEMRNVQDPALDSALDSLNNALQEAEKAVNVCCKVGVFVGSIWASRHNYILKQAASSLAHALDQISVATVGITQDIHDCLLTLTADLRKAHFRQTASAAQQTSLWKEEVELLYNDNRRSNKEAVEMIQSMIQEQLPSKEERLQDLQTLKSYLAQARKDKDRQEAFELEQIISVIEQSKEETVQSSTASVIEQIEQIITCPISREIMSDPVILVDSGISYNRDKILEWMRRLKGHDPVTKAEIHRGEVIPNLALKNVAEAITGDVSEEQHATDKCEDGEQLQLMPGVYEGYGTYTSKTTTVKDQFSVFVLEPDGNVLGYTLPKHSENPPFERHIFKGNWGPEKQELTFVDEYFNNEATVSVNSSARPFTFSLSGKCTPSVNVVENLNAVQPESYDFEYQSLTISSLMQHDVPVQGLMEMEGALFTGENKKLQQKLVLMIKEDFALNGWLYSVDPSTNQCEFGRIVEGSIEDTTAIDFILCFPVHRKRVSHACSIQEEPSARYHCNGEIEVKEQASGWRHLEFNGVCRRTSQQNKVKHTLPNFLRFSYDQLRQSSRNVPGHLLRNIKLLRKPEEPERVVALRISKIFTADRYVLRNVEQHSCLEISRVFGGMGFLDQNMVPCIWHFSPFTRPEWRIEKAKGDENFYIVVHGTDWSLRSDWFIPDGSYLTVASRDEFDYPGEAEFYLVVHPSKDRASVWNLSYADHGVRIRLVQAPPSYNTENFQYLATAVIPSEVRSAEEKGPHYATLTSDESKALKLEIVYQGVCRE